MHSKIVFVKVESSVINVEPKQRDTFHLVIECYLRNKTYVTVFYRGNKTWVRVRVRIKGISMSRVLSNSRAKHI